MRPESSISGFVFAENQPDVKTWNGSYTFMAGKAFVACWSWGHYDFGSRNIKQAVGNLPVSAWFGGGMTAFNWSFCCRCRRSWWIYEFINFFLHCHIPYAIMLPKRIFLFIFDKAIHFSRHRKIYALNSKKGHLKRSRRISSPKVGCGI